MVVAITTSQKNWLSRLNRSSCGAFWPIHGAIQSARRWERPVTPKPTAMISMMSVIDETRACFSWNSVTRCWRSSSAVVSAPRRASISLDSPAM